jgi:hypothetical protein
MVGDDNPRRELVEQLREKSALLQSQIADFRNLSRDYKIISFYEMQQSRRLKWVRRCDSNCSASILNLSRRTKRHGASEEPANISRLWIPIQHYYNFQTIWKSRSKSMQITRRSSSLTTGTANLTRRLFGI